MFLLVPAYPGCPGPKAVKRLCVCAFQENDIGQPTLYYAELVSDNNSERMPSVL